jgi:hypothetical protein
MIELVGQQGVQAEAVMTASAKNKVAFDGASVVVFAVLAGFESERKLDLRGEEVIVFAAVVEIEQVVHINASLEMNMPPCGDNSDCTLAPRMGGVMCGII